MAAEEQINGSYVLNPFYSRNINNNTSFVLVEIVIKR